MFISKASPLAMWRMVKKDHDGDRVETHHSITGGRRIVSISIETKDFRARKKKGWVSF